MATDPTPLQIQNALEYVLVRIADLPGDDEAGAAEILEAVAASAQRAGWSASARGFRELKGADPFALREGLRDAIGKLSRW